MQLHLRNTLSASRRQFMLGTLAVAGLAVGYRLVAAAPAAAEVGSSALNDVQAYVEITPENRIRIRTAQHDMGQGVHFGIATLVLEELGGDWSQVEVVGAYGDPKHYGNTALGDGSFEITGGSTSMLISWQRYRKAGAAARMMLVAAAAKRWKVAEREVSVANGVIVHGPKKASFGELAAAAAEMPIPADVPLKPKTAWTKIGAENVRRFDSARKTNGSQLYPIDLKMDGMLTAVIIHAPKFGATVKSFDASKAKSVAGVVDIVQSARGVSVVARDMWTALKARDLVSVKWDETAAEQRGSVELIADFKKLAAGTPAAIARNDGDANAALKAAAQKVEVNYEFPYLVHAPLEALNAVVKISDGGVEIWSGIQHPGLIQYAVAGIAQIPPNKVKLHLMNTGGAFGRRGPINVDWIVDAVSTAKALGTDKPIKLQWTRENDIRGGNYRPAFVHSFKGGLDKDGCLVALQDHMVGQSILSGTIFKQIVVNGVDPKSVEGIDNLPYEVKNLNVGITDAESKIPVLWWRSTANGHTIYALETFIDELASLAKRDPIEFRLSMLKGHSRHATVLRLAAEKAGWDRPLQKGHYRGVAVYEKIPAHGQPGTFVAQVAEITFNGGTDFSVDRVVCAVDCGIAINPDQIRAQMEGAVGFGLGAILQEELTLTNGVVDQENFDTYTPLRINQMPKVEVHIVPSDEPPTGVGEMGVAPVGPAVANALRAAIGKTIRILPIKKGLLAV